jgi:8-oxo-dGTP pyrophosphatase MutT (NUDIX family)
MIRHNTSTGIVVHDGAVLLIEHVKLGWWMPPGGHIDPNEDPVEAVLREILEETALKCEIASEEQFTYAGGGVRTIPRPFTILIEDVPESDGTIHQHIDFIYLLRPVSDPAALIPQDGEVTGIRWVRADQLGELPMPEELPALIEAALAHSESQAVCPA